MRWRALFRHAAQALRRHRLRSWLSTLGIVFAVIALVAMLAIAEGAKRETLAQIQQLGADNIVVRAEAGPTGTSAGPAGGDRGLTREDARALRRRVPGAVAIGALARSPAQVAEAGPEDPLTLLAVDAEYWATMRLPVRDGRFLCASDLERQNLVCVLGAEAARVVGREGYVGGAIRLGTHTYRVAGILRARQWSRDDVTAVAAHDFNRAVFVPLGTQPRTGKGGDVRDALSEIVVQVGAGTNVRAAAGVVERILRHRGAGRDVQIIVAQELLHQAQRTQRVFNVVLGGIAGISLLVGGIGIMNIMLAGVSERTKEIGIRRSVGASRRHVAAQFLAEAVLLSVSGSALGLVLGIASAELVSYYAGWRTAITVWTLVLAVAMAVGTGIASGLYPALRAAWLDPVEALRSE